MTSIPKAPTPTRPIPDKKLVKQVVPIITKFRDIDYLLTNEKDADFLGDTLYKLTQPIQELRKIINKLSKHIEKSEKENKSKIEQGIQPPIFSETFKTMKEELEAPLQQLAAIRLKYTEKIEPHRQFIKSIENDPHLDEYFKLFQPNSSKPGRALDKVIDDLEKSLGSQQQLIDFLFNYRNEVLPHIPPKFSADSLRKRRDRNRKVHEHNNLGE